MIRTMPTTGAPPQRHTTRRDRSTRLATGALVVGALLAASSCSGDEPERTVVTFPVLDAEIDDGAGYVADRQWGDGRAIGVDVTAGFTAIVTTAAVFAADGGEQLARLSRFSGDAADVSIELTPDGAGVVLAQASTVWTVDRASGEASTYDLGAGTAAQGVFTSHGTSMVATTGGVFTVTTSGIERAYPDVVPAGAVGSRPSVVLVPVVGGSDVVIDRGDGADRVTLPLADGEIVADANVSIGGTMAVSSSPAGDPFESEDRINVLSADGGGVRAAIETGGPLQANAWATTDEHVVVANGNELRVWSLDGDMVATVAMPTDSPVYATVQVVGGVFTVHADGAIVRWPAGGWQPQMVSEGGTTQVDVDVAADGSVVAIVDFYGGVVWRAGEDGRALDQTSEFAVGEATDVAIAADGRLAFSTSVGDAIVIDGDFSEVQTLRVVDERRTIGTVRFSQDGSTLAAGVAQRVGDIAYDDTVVAWGTDDAEVFRREGGEEDVAGCGFFNARISFSDDGRWMAVSSHDFSVDIYEVGTGEIVTVVEGPASILDLAFLPGDGRLIVSYDNATMSVRAADDFTEVDSFQTVMGGYQAMAPLGNSGLIAVADVTGNVDVVRVDDGVTVEQLGATGARPTTLAATVDGSLVAAPAEDGQIVVWSTAESSEVSRLVGHSGAVTGLAFADDGRTLASSSQDGTVRSWTLESA